MWVLQTRESWAEGVGGRGSPDEHVSELREFTVFLVLYLNEPPFSLTTQYLLTPHRHLTITADHSKWNVLLWCVCVCVCVHVCVCVGTTHLYLGDGCGIVLILCPIGSRVEIDTMVNQVLTYLWTRDEGVEGHTHTHSLSS